MKSKIENCSFQHNVTNEGHNLASLSSIKKQGRIDVKHVAMMASKEEND